jgi:hypothetical protein
MAHPPFNPLDKKHLGESVANALLARPIGPLPPPTRFEGAGIYAIYYTGRFRAYRPISNSAPNFEAPIYVGKAVPPGARKGGFGLGINPGSALFSRLVEHSRSIRSSGTLNSDDFVCRYLISDDIWIPLGEALTIERFKPIWNVLVDGFGNHPPGAGRQQQVQSRWDTLHPGRAWAGALPPNPQNADAILRLVRDFLAGRAVDLIPTEHAVEEEE